jgi:hypothetical protein
MLEKSLPALAVTKNSSFQHYLHPKKQQQAPTALKHQHPKANAAAGTRKTTLTSTF